MNPSSRRQFIRFMGIGTASMFLPLSACGRKKHPPNILLIMADDLGAKELGCYGHPHHQTPNLDNLAETGIRFRTCYAAPVCSPTRVMLMTGQYGFRNGWTDNRYRVGGAGDSEKAQIGDYHITFADIVPGTGLPHSGRR
ncbi:MAG: sulfatase-like hydrolase/transferase [candidate division KSB1 bacterium]|nr:sulfatase-like hydrolase/transferase [candidate division KSB1 bacterium]